MEGGRRPAGKSTFDELVAFAERVVPGCVQRHVLFVAAIDRVNAERFASPGQDGDGASAQMEQDIFTFGLNEPFLARASDAVNYELLAEHAAFAAAVRAGITCVRLVVADVDDGAAAALARAAAERLDGA